MSLQKLRTADVVVAAGKGRVNGNTFRLSVDLQLHSSSSVESAHGIDLRPGTQMDYSLQSPNVIQTLQRSNESSLTSQDDLLILAQDTLFGQGIQRQR